MSDILVPIGSDPAENAARVDQAIALYREAPARVHLLNVQRPLPRHVAQFFSKGDLRDFHHDAGMRLLDAAIRRLDDAAVPHQDHVMVGGQAQSIVDFAEQHACDRVVLDNTAKSLLSIFGLGSVSSQVRHLMSAHADTPTAGVSAR